MPAGLVLPYPSTYASIPANWTQEATLIDKFIKAWGTADPADTGGASEHSHDGVTHTHLPTDSHAHTVRVNTEASSQTFGGTNSDPIAQVGHDHADFTVSTRVGGNASDAIPYPAQSNNNHPPYMRTIFLIAGEGALLEDGMLLFWNSATIPDGYLMCSDGLNGAPALGNKYLYGASSEGDGGATGGSLTHDHVLDHSHSTSHSHTGTTSTDNNHPNRSNDGGSGGHKMPTHTHGVTLASATVDTDTYTGTLTSGTVEPAYKKLIALYKDGGAVKKGMIGIWIGSLSAIPKGWLLCNGQAWSDGVTYTPDLQDYFIKIANDTSELGNTGGSNTHEHTASDAHTHTQASAHTHTGSIASVTDSGSSSGSNTSSTSHSHSVSSVSNNTATLNWDSQTMSAESVDNQPEHVVVAFIQLEKPTMIHAGLLNV